MNHNNSKYILDLTSLRLALEQSGFKSDALNNSLQFLRILPNILDSIVAIMENGYHLPTWASDQIMVMLDAYEKIMHIAIINGNTFLQEKMGGELLNHIKKHFADVLLEDSLYFKNHFLNEYFSEKAERTTLKMYIGHEYNLVALINLLGGSCMAKAKESSAIIVELYRASVLNNISYNIFLNDDIFTSILLMNNSLLSTTVNLFKFYKLIDQENREYIYKLKFFYKAGPNSNLTPLRGDAKFEELLSLDTNYFKYYNCLD
ncbi:unnamed protein product [Gordionus sp. m RMFG-2023]